MALFNLPEIRKEQLSYLKKKSAKGCVIEKKDRNKYNNFVQSKIQTRHFIASLASKSPVRIVIIYN